VTEPKHWWQTFFSGLWLDVQRQRLSEGTVAEADFIESCLRLERGKRVLDIPCGNGRLSLELASRGYEMTGVDVTTVLLDEARARSKERGLPIAWEHRDMRDISWSDAFDAAFCIWGSFGYFDDAGNRLFLERVASALRPGAWFLLDAPNVAEQLLPIFQDKGWWRSGDVLVLEDRTYDYERSRIDVEWTLVRDGQQDARRSSMRVYGYRQLIELLEEVGFSAFEPYSTVDKEPFGLGKRLFLVAQKT
jgi:2-polyprenyl-3-methyl-5-hydroxy-6-metoxy-1,4-benzoquinol methylase